MFSLAAPKMVQENLPPEFALDRDTVWMVSFSTIIILFPTCPIGKKYALYLKTVIEKGQPVFIVTYK